MKEYILTTTKLLASDRTLAVLLSVLGLATVLYAVYVATSLRPTDLQVAVQYTAFGETNFYRDKWYYLLSFIGFAVLTTVLYAVLIVKMYLQERRQLALALAALSLTMLVVLWVITRSVLGVAFL